MKITLSSALPNELVVYYRFDGIIRERRIQARALNNTISFNSEEEAKAFKESAKEYFTSGKLIEGKSTEKKLVAENEKLAKETKEFVNSKKNEKLEEAADNVNAKLNIKEESVEKSKRGK